MGVGLAGPGAARLEPWSGDGRLWNPRRASVNARLKNRKLTIGILHDTDFQYLLPDNQDAASKSADAAGERLLQVKGEPSGLYQQIVYAVPGQADWLLLANSWVKAFNGKCNTKAHTSGETIATSPHKRITGFLISILRGSHERQERKLPRPDQENEGGDRDCRQPPDDSGAGSSPLTVSVTFSLACWCWERWITAFGSILVSSSSPTSRRNPSIVQRADIFREGGQCLSLRRDGSRWLWHYVGNPVPLPLGLCEA